MNEWHEIYAGDCTKGKCNISIRNDKQQRADNGSPPQRATIDMTHQHHHEHQK